MKFLLDTHAFLWWLLDDAHLGPQARALIGDPANDILVSVVSLWEIVVKKRVGKLDADIRQIVDAVQPGGFTLLDISAAHLVALADLPMHHRDPFDHLLMAQALSEGAIFLSDDRYASLYSVAVIRCSAAPPSI